MHKYHDLQGFSNGNVTFVVPSGKRATLLFSLSISQCVAFRNARVCKGYERSTAKLFRLVNATNSHPVPLCKRMQPSEKGCILFCRLISVKCLWQPFEKVGNIIEFLNVFCWNSDVISRCRLIIMIVSLVRIRRFASLNII